MLQNGVLVMSRLKIQMVLGEHLLPRVTLGLLHQMVVGAQNLVIQSLMIIGEVQHLQMEAGGLNLVLLMVAGAQNLQM